MRTRHLVALLITLSCSGEGGVAGAAAEFTDDAGPGGSVFASGGSDSAGGASGGAAGKAASGGRLAAASGGSEEVPDSGAPETGSGGATEPDAGTEAGAGGANAGGAAAGGAEASGGAASGGSRSSGGAGPVECAEGTKRCDSRQDSPCYPESPRNGCGNVGCSNWDPENPDSWGATCVVHCPNGTRQSNICCTTEGYCGCMRDGECHN